MQIGVPSEVGPLETRVAMTPEAAQKLVKKGAVVAVEKGIGASLGWDDKAYEAAGASVAASRRDLLRSSDLVLRVGKPPPDEVELLKEGSIHMSFLDPFRERGLIEALQRRRVSAFSMEMVPRSTRAQKLDALSSQHSLAGYYMVVLAAERLGKLLPMMMTPAGTIQPARVFVIGAGVAGLQAIATARRLGARVEAFDTRPVVKTEVQSLGAKFVEVDLGETGQDKQGYAKALTDEQRQKQLDATAKHCCSADIVITTAQLFGRKAPIVVTDAMLRQMRQGSVVVDYAANSGGNVEGSVPGEEVEIHGVRVIGLVNYPGRVAVDASRMYANNLYNLIDEFWKADKKAFELKLDDEIVQGCLVTHQGELYNETIRKAYGLEKVGA